MTADFSIGATADFLTEATGLLEPAMQTYFGPYPQIHYEFMPTAKPVVSPEQLQPYDAVIALAPHFTSASFEGVERLVTIARWGVGYDAIDVQACTNNDVLLCITRDAVRRPVAEGILTLLLALTRHLVVQDRLVREGRWHEKTRYTGIGLEGRTLGSVGVGNIGAELFRLLQPFGLKRLLGFDPYLSPAQAQEMGVELVDLPVLLAESDFICINCPLTPQTYHLIDEAQLKLVKSSALLINTARGPIINENALINALQEGRLAGAGLDVFEQEPLSPDSPLTTMLNVILTTHSIAWTDQLVRENGRGACENILTILRGDVPKYTVNRDVIERPRFQAKLRRLRETWRADSR